MSKISIPFNKPPVTGDEKTYILEALESDKLSGDGKFSKQCQVWFEKQLNGSKSLLTPNCTQALEMAAILIDVQPGDEIIMASYTFVSTANAFVMRGAKIVFVDIRPDTMNINEDLIEAAITEKTKAIVPVHYAGVACEMEKIMSIAKSYNLYVIEDAAQGMMSTYKGKPLGTIGHFGAYSFHETKNYTSGGEGGLLIINDKAFSIRAEIIREKGTNRSQFFRGMVDKYTWVDIGSSYLPSEIQAAYLYAQLQNAEKINSRRKEIWSKYYQELKDLEIGLPEIPTDCIHNAHMFYIKLRCIKTRDSFIQHLRSKGVLSVFHYIPLHSAEAGLKFGRFHSDDIFTTAESERLVRLPLFYNMSNDEVGEVVSAILEFFKNEP